MALKEAPPVLATSAPATADEVAPARRRPTLLVVDDEEGPRQSLRVIFKDDYEILMAADGPTAIELAQKHFIDVAVLDIRMAGMSGIEVLERLKYVDPGIEVVMMTAFETTDTMRQALRLRACDYINKPFDLATMRSAIANAMQRRTLESEIHNNAEQLEELMSELQNHKIAQQMSEKRGDIYASIIHDINGPLTVISGFIQLLNQRIGNASHLGQDDLEFIKDRLKTITRQVTNCISISRRYLSYLGRHSDDAPSAGVNEVLTDLNHLVNVHHSLHNHQFTIQPLAENVTARMNGTDLIQVLLNLAVNGLQSSSQPHSVTIRAQVLKQPIDLTRFKDGPQERFLNVESFDNTPPLVMLATVDTGPGIPPETLPKVFQPYFTTKGPQKGTGLGLNIVQRLIKAAHGALHIRSEVGKGTTFTIYLRAGVSASA